MTYITQQSGMGPLSIRVITKADLEREDANRVRRLAKHLGVATDRVHSLGHLRAYADPNKSAVCPYFRVEHDGGYVYWRRYLGEWQPANKTIRQANPGRRFPRKVRAARKS